MEEEEETAGAGEGTAGVISPRRPTWPASHIDPRLPHVPSPNDIRVGEAPSHSDVEFSDTFQMTCRGKERQFGRHCLYF